MDFFQSAELPRDSNVTWVALTLKFVGAREIKDLRPISMVGCVYKVILKVLVWRMRKVMLDLVGETQSVFVQGRKIHDGALIACETVQWLKQRKKKSAIIKLDFQKAYDRVKWKFVDIVLQKMGFGQRWRGWIKECVCTASMSLLINGSPSKSFKMEWDLRQGDPLSLFLFVHVVEFLYRMVGEAVRHGRISPLLVGKDNIELSHLQFADDTILFCPPEEETICNYKRLLRYFEMISGLSINFDKSSLIPINCEREWSQRMCSLLGYKVEEKLNLWKAKTINKAGKLVLIKSVLNSLPVYYLSLYKMLRAIVDKLISLQRRFLWSNEDGMDGDVFPRLFSVSNQVLIGYHVALQAETLPEDITSYSFTRSIWRGLVPQRVELFTWCSVLGYMPIINFDLFQEPLSNTLRVGQELL
ncbi:uncharacterized protein LOC107636871 [Arachis ipaensis]|uniref:uncharacterized protein LOC107636871 n=1 Tax=Arachis ipaensis TaxID=130454 RepID=UPI0007AEFB19|nr:uncharacterized protein LOC107636871 [Arachis ipaensis]